MSHSLRTRSSGWQLPFDPTAYDRAPVLSAAEQAALRAFVEALTTTLWWPPSGHSTVQPLTRLLVPIDAMLTVMRCPQENHTPFKRFLLLEMYQRQSTYWAWSDEDWTALIAPTPSSFHQQHAATKPEIRLYLVAMGYLLTRVPHVDHFQGIAYVTLSKKVFGAPHVEAAVQRVLQALQELGRLRADSDHALTTTVSYVLLTQKCPLLEAITREALESLQHTRHESYMRYELVILSNALVHLGVIARPLEQLVPRFSVSVSGDAPQHRERDQAYRDLQNGVPNDVDSSVPDTIPPGPDAPWQWPLNVAAYDRTPQLMAPERQELAVMMNRFAHGILPWRNASRDTLQRLLHPLYDVFQVIEIKSASYSRIAHIMLEEMHRRQTSFWAWSEAEWLETIGQYEGDFHLRHQGKKNDPYRQALAAIGYLLCRFTTLTDIDRLHPYPLACKIFGVQRVDDAVQSIHHPLTSWGYAQAHYKGIKNALCIVLLSNRSPLLRDISLSLLESLQASQMQQYLKPDLLLISIILVQQGVLEQPLARQTFPQHVVDALAQHADADASSEREDRPSGHEYTQIDAVWLQWCQRWQETSTLTLKSRRSLYYVVRQAGRWLWLTHPAVNTPALWTRELAAEYVSEVSRLTVGQWTQPATIPAYKMGKPVTPRHQDHILSGMRRFFRDCQEWEWIPVTFDPSRSFATPRTILGKIGPNPRILADDVWAKLLAAGLSVTAEDFLNPALASSDQHTPTYPLEMLRALVVVWLFSGLRSDEIHRLRVGCARFIEGHRTEEPTIAPDVLPHTRICLLDIPVNKTATAFTKPVDVLVGEAIMTWEKVRPSQPAMLDSTTGELVQFLFAFRLTRLARVYLNTTIIPVLCRKAGIPQSDARGTITSHRARSTIASQLANAKEPMTLFELQQWLGHKSVESTRSYIKSSPMKLAQAYGDAEYFKRNLRMIDVLIDQDVIKSGAASRNEPWRFYDLGHGYCTYDFFEQCPHRMACAKCAFYRPKGSSQAQIVEAKANLLRMKHEIPLSDEERAAVDDGVSALEKLCDHLLDTPTPAGPTPRELKAPSNRMLPVRSR